MRDESITSENYLAIIDVEERRAVLRRAEKEVEAAAALRLEKEKTKRDRHELWMTAVVGFFVTAIACTLILWWAGVFRGPPGPVDHTPSHDQIEQQREQSCLADGGGWVPDTLIVDGDKGLCVFPGKVVGK